MSNRDSLAMRARVVGLDPATITNDSVLEERVLYLERTAGAATGTLATGTLTSDATAPSNNDTVTIGSVVYTFKTTLTGAANEVLIGASAAAALDNLKSAINASAGAGTTYGLGTVAHPEVTADANTDTTQVVTAKFYNNGNTVATTENGTHTSWGAATLTGGVPAVIVADATQASRVPRGSAV